MTATSIRVRLIRRRMYRYDIPRWHALIDYQFGSLGGGIMTEPTPFRRQAKREALAECAELVRRYEDAALVHHAATGGDLEDWHPFMNAAPLAETDDDLLQAAAELGIQLEDCGEGCFTPVLKDTE